MVKIYVNKKELIEVLYKQKSIYKRSQKKLRIIQCELTITDNLLTVTSPGCKHTIKCKTKGVAKVSVHLLYLYQLIKDQEDGMLSIIINDGEMRINQIVTYVNTNFIENDRVLRSIDIPIGYDDYYLLKLRSKNYTREELDFNRVTPMIKDAERRLEKNIEKAYEFLGEYHVPKNQLKHFILDSILKGKKGNH